MIKACIYYSCNKVKLIFLFPNVSLFHTISKFKSKTKSKLKKRTTDWGKKKDKEYTHMLHLIFLKVLTY